MTDLVHFREWLGFDVFIAREHGIRSVGSDRPQFNFGAWPEAWNLKRSDSFETLLSNGTTRDNHHHSNLNQSIHSYLGLNSCMFSNGIIEADLPRGENYRVSVKPLVDMYYRVWSNGLIKLHDLPAHEVEGHHLLTPPAPIPTQSVQVTNWQSHICSLQAPFLGKSYHDIWFGCLRDMATLYDGQTLINVSKRGGRSTLEYIGEGHEYRNSLPVLPHIPYPNPFAIAEPIQVEVPVVLNMPLVDQMGVDDLAEIPTDVQSSSEYNTASGSPASVMSIPDPINLEGLNPDEQEEALFGAETPPRRFTPEEEQDLLDSEQE